MEKSEVVEMTVSVLKELKSVYARGAEAEKGRSDLTELGALLLEQNWLKLDSQARHADYILDMFAAYSPANTAKKRKWRKSGLPIPQTGYLFSYCSIYLEACATFADMHAEGKTKELTNLGAVGVEAIGQVMLDADLSGRCHDAVTAMLGFLSAHKIPYQSVDMNMRPMRR